MPLSILAWVWSVVRTVQGESGMGEGKLWRGGSWTGALFGDSFDALYEPMEDMGLMNLEWGGVDWMASCRCWQ
jgi:hypothetical protein